MNPDIPVAAARPRTGRETLAAALGAAMLGAVLVYLAGFAQMEALHHGGHDTRHAAALPCH